MNRNATLVVVVAALGCASSAAPTASPPNVASAAVTSTESPAPSTPQSITGTAGETKGNPYVEADRRYWIHGLDAWPSEWLGARVTVRGEVTEKAHGVEGADPPAQGIVGPHADLRCVDASLLCKECSSPVTSVRCTP